MRNGRKVVTDHLVIYLNRNETNTQARFGFVVPKSTGSAVSRNLVKRRMRSAIRDRLNWFVSGDMLVVRALPGSAELPWILLGEELGAGLRKLEREVKS